MRSRITVFIAVVQAILFVTHLFLYATWIFFWGAVDSSLLEVRVVMVFLSISFVAASLLAFKFSNIPVRIFYTLSAVWLGLVNFLFLAACACWVVYLVPALFGVNLERRPLAIAFLALALLTGLCGIVNAYWTRVRRVTS